jgi:hypothetical protein
MTHARSPGRRPQAPVPARAAGSASPRHARPSRSVIALLLAAGLLLTLSLALAAAPVALADVDDGTSASDTGGTDTGGTDTSGTDTGGTDTSGTAGSGGPDLAGDYGPGGYGDYVGGSSPGGSTSNPSAGQGPSPTAHEGLPPSPVGNPFGTPVDPFGGQFFSNPPSLPPGLSLGPGFPPQTPTPDCGGCHSPTPGSGAGTSDTSSSESSESGE